MSVAWYEDKPSDAYKARIEKAADREIENLSLKTPLKTTQVVRRSFFADFFSSWRDITLTAGWASGMAAIAAVWFVTKNEEGVNGQDVDTANFDVEFQKLNIDDFNLVADLELFEELDLLEMMSEEDLERGESES